MNDKIQAWLAIAGAVLGPIAVWYWRFIERRDTRHDKGSDWQEKRDERAWSRMEKELERCHEVVSEKDKHIEAAERERDIAWGLARSWYQQAADFQFQAKTLCRVLNDRPEGSNKIEVPSLPAFRSLMKDQ